MKSRPIASWIFATVWLVASAFTFIRNVSVRYSSVLRRRKTASSKHAIAAILILGLPCALPASEGNLSVVNGDYEYHYYGQVVPMQVLHADMTANFSNPDVMWGYSIQGETFSFLVETQELRKDANGDWWADWVSINGVEKEYQNLGPDPFLWGLQAVYAANGASSPGAWMSCDFGYPPSTYRASTVALSVNGIANTGGIQHISVQGGTSLTFNMSASAPNNNCSHIWLEATANEDESNWLYLESNNSWQNIYSTSGTSGSFSYTLDPDVNHYYFLCRSMGDTVSAPAITHVVVATNGNTIQGWDVTLYEGQEIWFGVDYGSFLESARGVGYDDYDNVHPLQFMISGHTDWRTVTGYGSYESETWMPPQAGDYQIYYKQPGNDEWADSNVTGPHTLHVLPARATAQDLTVPVGTLALDTFTSVANLTIAPGLTFSPHVVIQGYGEDPNLSNIPVGTYQFQIKYTNNNDPWDDPYDTYCGAPAEILSPTYTLVIVLRLPCMLPASGGNLSVVNGDYEYHYYGQVIPMQALHADMTANFSNPDVMWWFSMHGETFSFSVEAWELRKDANGDWWADWVSINGVEKEYQNLGPDPFLWGLQAAHAANGASSPGAWISCDFGYPPPTYRASTVALSVNGIAHTGGIQHIYAQGGTSLMFNMSASAPNNNCSHIWLEATANEDESNWLYLESNNSWQIIYSTSGTSGSFSYTLDPDVRHYYFLCRSMGDMVSAPAITHVEVTTTTGSTSNTIQGWDVTLYEGQEIWPGVNYGSFVGSSRVIGYDGYGNVHPLQYMISGHTEWRTVTGYGSYESEAWMPPHAGDYQIYYMQIGNDEWADSNIAGPYTLHVLPARVTAQDITVPVGTLALDTFTSVANVTIAPELTFSPHVVIQGYGEDTNLNTIPAGTYQFQIKYTNNNGTWDDPYDTYCGAPSEILSPTYTLVVAPPAPPGPVLSLNITASALNGQISASGGDGMAVYLGETISVTSIATASGWLSEHNIKGYASDTSPFSISGGSATLPALLGTTTSRRTVTWTPTSAGPHTLYAEAFTGTYPGHQLHGAFGWPGYAEGMFNGYENKRVSVHVRNNPTGSVQILDANQSPISMENGVVTITRGSTYYVKVSGSDADGDAERYYARMARPDGTLAVHVDASRDSGSGSSGSRTFGPYTADTSGDWLYWGHVTDVTARTWDSVTPWNENGNGWYSSDKCTLRVPNVNGAAYVSQSVPAILSCGEHAVVSVTMQNNDTTTWDGNAPMPYSLGSQNPQDNYTWGFSQVSVGATPVQPGGTKTFTFTITAPGTAGEYDFQWRMVQDGKEWFGDSTPNVAIQVIDLTALGEDGIPIGLTLDSNNNDVPDLVEQRLGLGPMAPATINNADPRIQDIKTKGTRAYTYDANGQLVIAPERTFAIDPEGNITNQ